MLIIISIFMPSFWVLDNLGIREIFELKRKSIPEILQFFLCFSICVLQCYEKRELAIEQSEEGQAQQGEMNYVPPHAFQNGSPIAASHIAFQQAHHFQHHHHHQQLQMFWANQMQEIEHTTDFKNHTLPLARIKKIMKADEDVRMISAEAPVIFAKACEMFILELTLRAWIHTEENKRRTLQKNDIAAAISRSDVFDFLVDIIPKDDLKEEGLGVTKGTIPSVVGSPPYYYLQQQGMMPPWHQEQHHDES